MVKEKIIKCTISLVVIVLCVVLSYVVYDYSYGLIKNIGNMSDLSLAGAYTTIISSLFCLVGGIAAGYIIRTLSAFKGHRRVFLIVFVITIIFLVIEILMGIEWICATMNIYNEIPVYRFLCSTIGGLAALYLLYYGSFVFIPLGLVDVLFWKRKERKEQP